MQGFESTPEEATNVRWAVAAASGAIVARHSDAQAQDRRRKRRAMIVSDDRGRSGLAQSFGTDVLNAPLVVLLTRRLSTPDATEAPALALTPVTLRVIVESET